MSAPRPSTCLDCGLICPTALCRRCYIDHLYMRTGRLDRVYPNRPGDPTTLIANRTIIMRKGSEYPVLIVGLGANQTVVGNMVLPGKQKIPKRVVEARLAEGLVIEV